MAVIATLYDKYDPSSTTYNNGYRLRLLVEQESYDAATNSSSVRFRLILYTLGSQWFDGWEVTMNVDYYTFDADGTKNAAIAVANSPSGQQTQGSAGADKTWVNSVKTIQHDKNGDLRMIVHGDFKTNTAPSTSYPYLVPALSIGVASGTSPNTSTAVNGVIKPSDPTALSVTHGAVNLSANTKAFTLSASGSTVVAGHDGSHSISYNYYYSTDNTNWSACSSSVTLTARQKYYFKATASAETTSDGAKVTGVYYGYPESVSSLPISRQTTFGNGNKINLSWSAPSTTGSGATISQYNLAYASSSDNGATWSDWSSEVSTAGTSYTFTMPTLGRRYKFYVEPYSATSGYTGSVTESTYSYVPNLPTASSITSLTKDVKKTITAFSDSAFDSATGTGYEVSARYSGDNGSTWSSWSTLSSSAISPYTSADLNIAKLYEIRVRPYSDVGFGSYSTSSQIFISAYGYRIDSSLNAVAIELAARYTGNESDSIVVGSETKTGWKQIESMKRYDGTSFIDFIQ
jgi:hypothetical protein